MKRRAMLAATVCLATAAAVAPSLPVSAEAPPGVAGHAPALTGAQASPRTGAPAPADPPDVSLANVKAHLQQLQSIADGTGGTRRSASPGYLGSIAYIEAKLRAAGYTVVLQPCTSGCSRDAGPNLIADWPGGDDNQVVMAGAHLDSVAAGPGINDNGSGSASLLEVALTLAAQRPTMSRHVRFGWWTDEEQGLNGSAFYVNSLSAAERSKIKFYHNYDMVGSSNGGYFINNITTEAAQYLKEFYDKQGLQPEENVEGANRSDDASFRRAGIPTSGVAAGASAVKTAAQAAKWGGTAGEAYDSCYHQSCDTAANVSDTVLDRAADAAAYGIWRLATSGATVPGRGFSVATTPASGSVQAGDPVMTVVSTATTEGAPQTVALTAQGLPADATATFTPASVTSGGSSVLTVSTAASTPAGTYNVTVTGTGETGTATAAYALTVQGGSSDRTFRNDADYAVRDRSTVRSAVTSTASGTAKSPVKVVVTMNHTCAEDLAIRLRGPNGLSTLIDPAGGSSCTSYGTRTYSVPVSQQAAGEWVLEVSDRYAGDTGTLDWWSIAV